MSLSRRVALQRLAAAGTTVSGVLRVQSSWAQFGGELKPPPAPDPKFPPTPAWESQVKEVAPGAYAFIQGGGPGKDNMGVSNCGFIVGPDGVLVIDTTWAPLHAIALRDAIRKVTDKPFRHVVITHRHADHFNGTQYFPGAEVISHPLVREQILREEQGPPLWPRIPGKADGTEPRKIIVPSLTFEGKLTLQYGSTPIEFLQFVPAHTYGDTVVYLPQHGVMWLGDIGFFHVAPWLHESNPSQWIETCKQIEAMPVKTLIPGHGPIGGKAELADMRGWMELLRKESRLRYDRGMSVGAAAAQIRLGRYDNWVGPERLLMGVQRFYQEFGGRLTSEMDAGALDQGARDYNAARNNMLQGAKP